MSSIRRRRRGVGRKRVALRKRPDHDQLEPESDETVDASFTSKEITRGFAVLLRQFDCNDERASFRTVNNRFSKASMAPTDSHASRRCRHLDAWRTARGALLGLNSNGSLGGGWV